jgi:hypothetical protein
VAVEPQERYHRVPQGGNVLRRMTFVNLAGIFAQSHIPDVMRAVFDVPMVPPPSQQLDRSGQRARHACDRVLDLDYFASLAPRRAGQPANLLQAGPIDVACQSRGDFQLSADEATVFLADRFRAIKMRDALAFVRRGKKPPEIRRQRPL